MSINQRCNFLFLFDMPPDIQTLTSDLDFQAVELLFDAFKNDPAYKWIYCSPRILDLLLPHIQKTYLEHIRAARGLLLYIPCSSDVSVVESLCIVLPPETSWPEDLWMQFEEEHRKLYESILDLQNEEVSVPIRRALYHQFYELSRDDRDESFYIVLLATRPELQGKGNARRLVEYVRSKAKEKRTEGVGDGSVTVECSETVVEWYKKSGFKITRNYELGVMKSFEGLIKWDEEIDGRLDCYVKQMDGQIQKHRNEFDSVRIACMKQYSNT